MNSQSAMEYLMTYGWAILIIAVVLGALYSLGIFNGANFLGGTCVAAPGYLCSNPLIDTDGTLSFTYGYQGPNVTIVGFACTNTTTAPSSFASSGSSNIEPGQEESVSVSCPLPSSATIGSPYSGYLWVEYDQAGQSDLIARFATVRLSVSFYKPEYIYCVGSYGSGGVGYSGMITGADVKSWMPINYYNNPPYGDSSCVSSSGYMYCLGGLSTSLPTFSNTVQYSPIGGGGDNVWSQSPNIYPIGDVFSSSCVAQGGRMYCVGGWNPPTNGVFEAVLNGNAVGPWTAAGANYPIPIYQQSCLLAGGDIYCIGGSNEINQGAIVSNVFYAPISGTQVSQWAATSNYPYGVIDQSCTYYSGYIYCIGGQGVPGDKVTYSVPVLSGGGLGQWAFEGNYPTNVYGENCFAYNAHLYCVGGYYFGSNDVATISQGTIGQWSPMSAALPVTGQGNENMGCVLAP